MTMAQQFGAFEIGSELISDAGYPAG